jgi:hypothetical protein
MTRRDPGREALRWGKWLVITIGLSALVGMPIGKAIGVIPRPRSCGR